jgi:DNA polymerase III subunit gamma/tau
MTEMMSGASSSGYRVLARKYRPQTFADLIGQEAVVRTLTNAFVSGRIAQAYVLTGVRGVGKTTTARLIARALNYPGGPSIEMPELSADCSAILESRHIDVIEMDAASNTGVDNMREIIEAVRYAPVAARHKVYIIDEVHMLSKSAFNALLKTLEEPPPHVKFIFATTEIRKVPVTILSRCQRFDLRRLDASLLVEHLRKIAALESVDAEEGALVMIARAAEGSVRDALSLLDQAIAHGEGSVKAMEVQAMLGLSDRSRVIDLFDAVMAGDAARAIREIEEQHAAGGDARIILTDLADFVHWVTRLKVVPDAAADSARSEDERKRGSDYASRLAMPHLARAWQMLLKGLKEAEDYPDPLMAAEMLLIRLAYAASLPTGEDLVKLARGNGGGAPASSPPRPAEPLRQIPAETIAPPAGQLAVKPAPARQESPPPPEARVPAPSLTSFRDVVALVSDKRDIKLKNQLERLVRPIRVSAGQIELALEPTAPPGLPGELARKLESWTGTRWMVLVAKEGGEKPLAQQARDNRDTLFREAGEHPDVQAILKRFPGAEIVDVRDPEPATDDLNPEKDEIP